MNTNILYFTSLLLGLFIILNIIYYTDFKKKYVEKFNNNSVEIKPQKCKNDDNLKKIATNVINVANKVRKELIDNNIPEDINNIVKDVYNSLKNIDIENNNTKIYSKVSNTTDNKNLIINNKYKDDEFGKLISRNFIFINSYEPNNISNNDLKWYCDNIDKSKMSLTDININSYFNYNNPINSVYTNIIKLTRGALLKNVELKGPLGLYFSNDNKKYEINKFTLMFIIKFNKITGVNTLFEMLCNTSVIDDIDEKKEPFYIPNSISISIIEDKDSKYKIEIVIGSSKYIINNIDKNIFIGNDLVYFSLAFNTINLEFMINNTIYKLNYDQKLKQKIIAGSIPVVINKTGELDIILYSYAYFKEFLTTDDINRYKIYNNNFLYGVNNIENAKLETLKKVKILENTIKEKENEIININERLDQCSKSKMYELTSKLDNCLIRDYNNDIFKIEDIDKLELKKINIDLPNGGKNIIKKCNKPINNNKYEDISKNKINKLYESDNRNDKEKDNSEIDKKIIKNI